MDASREAFLTGFLTAAYLLGRRQEDLLAQAPGDAAELRLARALLSDSREQRARGLAIGMLALTRALEARGLR
jgi:hypothetical protein